MKKLLFISLLFLSAQLHAQWGHWEKLESENSPSSRYNHDLATIGQNKVLMFGGNLGKDHSDLNETWIYDYSENNWYQIQCDSSPAPRNDHRMIQISEKEVLLYAGNNSNMSSFNDVWIFNLDSLNWFRIETINNPKRRFGHNISKYSENEVLVFGGEIPFGIGFIYTNETWIYNIDTREWREIKDVDESLEGRYRFMMANDEYFKTIMYGGKNNLGRFH